MTKKTSKRSTTPHQRLSLPIILACLGLVALGAWYFVTTRLQKPAIMEVGNNSSNPVNLRFAPANIILNSGSTVAASIVLDTYGQKVAAAQVELTYDPTKFETLNITQGPMLTNVLKSPQIGNGKITFIYGAAPETGGVSGTQVLATLTLKAKPGTPAETTITVTNNTQIAVVGSSQNALQRGSDLKINEYANSTVNRAQLAELLVRNYNLSTANPKGTFNDVPTTHPLALYIESLYTNKVTSGCAASPTLLYCPDRMVTKAESAILTLASWRRTGAAVPAVTPAQPTYSDVPTTHWAYAAAESLAAKGVYWYCDANAKKFCPDQQPNGTSLIELIRTTFTK